MLDVPSPTISGESIELTCSYELTKGKDKLYSVKWYNKLINGIQFQALNYCSGIKMMKNSIVLSHKIGHLHNFYQCQALK